MHSHIYTILLASPSVFIKPQLYLFTFPEVHNFSFLSFPIIHTERVAPASVSYLPRFQKKLFPLNNYQSAPFIVLLQIPPRSSPWPWCLKNTWQYMLSCWLMQLRRFLTLHIGLLSFVVDLDCKVICPCVYSAKLNCSRATIVQWVNNNCQINKFWKIRGK